jgi:PucR C-terminal helix-turn-helix domain
MLENLMRHYKEAMTTTYNPKDTSFEWFQTELRQTFGILKTSLDDKERELLSSLFHPIKIIDENNYTSAQRRWFDFLFTNTQTLQSPLPAKQTTLRFYYFYLKQPIDEKQSFEEAVQGIINSDLIIWLSFTHGIIIDEKPTTIFEVELLKDISDMLTADFYVEPYLYIGQLHKNDDELKSKFSLEQSCFQTLYQSADRKKALTFSEALPLLIMKEPTIIKKDILSNQLVEAIEDKELLQTIEAFLLANLNASSTAKKLFIHRNSLQYRLEKLLEKTGLDIRTFPNAAFIYLAIIIFRQEK